MEKQSLNIVNAAILVAIIAIFLFGWLYLREQFMWAIILIAIILLFAAYINFVRKFPWQGTGLSSAIVAAAIVLILGFAWFYMREQFCWAGYVVVVILLLAEVIKISQWLKDVVSIQVIVHKKEGEDRDKK